MKEEKKTERPQHLIDEDIRREAAKAQIQYWFEHRADQISYVPTFVMTLKHNDWSRVNKISLEMQKRLLELLSEHIETDKEQVREENIQSSQT